MGAAEGRSSAADRKRPRTREPAVSEVVAVPLPSRTRRAVDRRREQAIDTCKETGRAALERIICADQFSRKYGRAPAEFQSLQTALAELTVNSHGLHLLEWWERRAARASGTLQNLLASLHVVLLVGDAEGLVDRIRRLERVRAASQYWDGAVGGLAAFVRQGVPLSADRLRAFGELHLLADDEAHRRGASFAADAANLLAGGASMSFLLSREVEREERLLSDAHHHRSSALVSAGRLLPDGRDVVWERDHERGDGADRDRDRERERDRAERAERRKSSGRGGRGGRGDNAGRGGGGGRGGADRPAPSVVDPNACSRCFSTEHPVEQCKSLMKCRHCKMEGHAVKNCPTK